ncbi:MAG TPA: lipopolysaccharide biosynthesis protein [Pirellulales bacterium]|nr:lipopolysaccharide biosynthesis protein [Pirellulales bacterium]
MASIVTHPAPVTGWRRLFADIATVSVSTIACQAIGVATSLLLRVALSPAQMGVWQGLKLLLSYANYANLGISKGAARELAIARGHGNLAAAERGLDLAFTFNTLTSVVYAGGLLATAGWMIYSTGEANAWSIGLAALALLVVLQRHLTFHVTILRCRQAFALTAQLALIEAALTLAVAGAASWRWGLPGLYAGTTLVILATLATIRWRGVRPFRWAWDAGEIRRLVAIGGPILAGSVMATLFQSLDKLMILGCSQNRAFELGCYSTSLLVTGQVYGLANMLSIAMLPRYGELFGKSGCRQQTARLAARFSEFLAATSAAAAIGAMQIAPPILDRWLPDYRPGLAPLAYLLPGVVAWAMVLPLNQYLVAVGHERRALLALGLATGLGACGDYLALHGGHGLIGVAIATSLAYTGCYLFTLAISLWPQLSSADRRRYLCIHALVLASVTAATVAPTLRGGDLRSSAATAVPVTECRGYFDADRNPISVRRSRNATEGVPYSRCPQRVAHSPPRPLAQSPYRPLALSPPRLVARSPSRPLAHEPPIAG